MLNATQGTISRWVEERGFGFIKQDQNGPDIFCHCTVTRRCGLGLSLPAGTKVRVLYEESERGPRAVRVEIVNHQGRSD